MNGSNRRTALDAEPPVRIEVIRGQLGRYGWSISVAGANPARMLETIFEVDRALKDHLAPPAAAAREGGQGKSQHGRSAGNAAPTNSGLPPLV